MRALYFRPPKSGTIAVTRAVPETGCLGVTRAMIAFVEMARLQVQSGHDPLEGVGADGTIVTGARRSRITDAFEPVLKAALDRLRCVDGSPSLYIYGSVATGTARVGTSDVDLVTIGLDSSVAKRLASDLTAAFLGLCRGVEIGAAQLSDYEGSGDEAYGNRVFLRHYCVHLAGSDVGSTLPAFLADRAAARGFNGDIGLRAEQWHAALRESDPAWLARRIARKTLFAVSGLVSVHDAAWTTDRVAATHRWSVIRPGLAAALTTLVAWADGGAPESSRSEIQTILDGVVADVVDEFQDRIGLWS